MPRSNATEAPRLEAKGQVTVRGTGITIDAGAGTVDVRGTTINLN